MKNIIWRSRASALLGILVAIIPFIGIPQGFKNWFLVLLGLLIAIFGYAKSHYARNEEEERGQVYNDNQMSISDDMYISSNKEVEDDEKKMDGIMQ